MADVNQLASDIKRGNEEAIGLLYEATYSNGILTAEKYMGNRQDAEDMVQEAFLKVMSHMDSYNENQEFGAWHYTILVNTCKNELARKDHKAVSNFTTLNGANDAGEQKENFENTIESMDLWGQPEQAYAMKDLRNVVTGILAVLPPEQQQALRLFHYEDMPIKQIAETQQVGEDTVKSRLNYGRQKVRAAVEDYEKKNGIRLHSIAPLPLLYVVYKAAKMSTLATAGVAAAAAGTEVSGAGVAAAGGTTAMTSVGTAAGVAGVANTIGTVGVGVVTKASLALGAKLAIGAAAVALGVGAGFGTSAVVSRQEAKKAAAGLSQIGAPLTPGQGESDGDAASGQGESAYAVPADVEELVNQPITEAPIAGVQPEMETGTTGDGAGGTEEEGFAELLFSTGVPERDTQYYNPGADPELTQAIFEALGKADGQDFSFSSSGNILCLGFTMRSDIRSILGDPDYECNGSDENTTVVYYRLFDEETYGVDASRSYVKLEFCDLVGTMDPYDYVLYRVTFYTDVTRRNSKEATFLSAFFAGNWGFLDPGTTAFELLELGFEQDENRYVKHALKDDCFSITAIYHMEGNFSQGLEELTVGYDLEKVVSE